MNAVTTLVPPVKVCSSGHAWSREAWDALPSLGVQEVPAGDDGPAYALELKQCPHCETCMAIEMPADVELADVAGAFTRDVEDDRNDDYELRVERDRGRP